MNRRGDGLVLKTHTRSVKAMQTLTRNEITRLSPEERLALIGQLWDSLHDAEVTLPPEQREELSRRLASFDQDRTQAVTWEHLRAELARRCP